MLGRLVEHFRSDLAVDIGAAQTRVGAVGAGIVLEEPSIVARAPSPGPRPAACRAFGHLARQMLGRTPGDLVVVRPLAGGAVSDIRLCAAMLRHFLRKAQPPGFRLRPRVLVGMPGWLTSVERQALIGSLHRAGAGEAWLMPSVAAAAVGCGLPIREPLCSMVCILGASATEAAVLSMGGIVASHCFRTGGDALDQAICDYLRRRKGVVIGPQAAESLRMEAAFEAPDAVYEVAGADAQTAAPRQATVSGAELREAMSELLLRIAEGVRAAIDRLSPELAADLTEQGIVLCGGLAQMQGMDRYLREQTGIAVRLATDPPRALANGLVQCLEHFPDWRGLMHSSEDTD